MQHPATGKSRTLACEASNGINRDLRLAFKKVKGLRNRSLHPEIMGMSAWPKSLQYTGLERAAGWSLPA